MQREIHFYYDIVCPYAYMAATRMETFAAAHHATVVWKPVLLGGILRAVGSPDVPEDHMAEPKRVLGRKDVYRQAERIGVHVQYPDDHPRRTVDAMRLLVATPEAFRPALTLDLYKAYWSEGRDVSDFAVLSEIALRHGLDASVVKEPAIKEALFEATAEAVEAGAFGVPSFVVDDQLFWGQDRLHLAAARFGGLPPEPTWMDVPDRDATLTFFHDFSSPFSYLGWRRVQDVARRQNARLEIVPFLLGALFKDIGTPLVPIQAMNERRSAYARKDLLDHAAFHGIRFHWNDVFPLNTVAALRVAIQEPRATDCLYKAAWADNRDISDKTELMRVLHENGFFAAQELLEGTQNPEIKAVLRANTERARAAGACGAPTFVVDGEVLFWGQDRLDMVEAALAGWRPARG